MESQAKIQCAAIDSFDFNVLIPKQIHSLETENHLNRLLLNVFSSSIQWNVFVLPMSQKFFSCQPLCYRKMDCTYLRNDQNKPKKKMHFSWGLYIISLLIARSSSIIKMRFRPKNKKYHILLLFASSLRWHDFIFSNKIARLLHLIRLKHFLNSFYWAIGFRFLYSQSRELDRGISYY